MKLFTASWCAPCKVVKMELLSYKHSIDIIDVDEQPELTRASGVRSVPSLLLGNGDVLTGVTDIVYAIRAAYGHTIKLGEEVN